MSSFTRKVAKAMLTAHGYQICNKKMCGGEVAGAKNPYKTNNNSMVDAMALLARAAKQHNCTCVIKVNDSGGMRLVKDMYATPGADFSQDWEFVILFRSNLLDRQVCMIRENKHEHGMNNIGQSVFPNGTKFTPTEFRSRWKRGCRKRAEISRISAEIGLVQMALFHLLPSIPRRGIFFPFLRLFLFSSHITPLPYQG